MKKTIFLMVLLMSALHVTAQEYDPKLTIQSPREIFEATEDIYNYPYKKWFAAVDNEGKPALAYTCLTTDSVIDGRNYVASSTIPYASAFQADELVICYRQEGDKVYYYDDQQKKDILLFDFGLKEGDKFRGNYDYFVRVAEIGTFPEVAQYLGKSRENKMFRLVDNYDGTDVDIWVDGIGSLKHGILPFEYPYNLEYKTLGLTFHDLNDHCAVNLTKFKQHPFEPIDLTMDELRELHNNGKECPCILTATFEEDTLHLTGISDFNCNSYDMIAILTDNNHISLTIPMYEAEALACRHSCRYDVKLPGFTCGTYTIDVNEKLGIHEPITLKQTRYNLTVPYRSEDAMAQYIIEHGYDSYYEDYRQWEYHTTNAEGKPGNLFTRAAKDVVLDGRTYVQLINGWYNDLYHSYMRQVGKQVLRYNPDTKTETVVLDYSLDVGDEFTTETGDHMRVTEVGSFEEYAQYFYRGDGVRRMLRLQGVDNPELKDVWVEGFGSVYTGVLPPEIYANYPEIHLKWCSDTGNFAVNQKHYKSIPFEAEELDKNTQFFLLNEATDEDIPFVCEFIGNDLHVTGYFNYTCSTSQYAELTIADDGTVQLSFEHPATYHIVAPCSWPGYYDLIFPDFEPGNYHISLTNLRGHTQEFDLTLEPTPYRPFVEEGKVWKVGQLINENTTARVQYYYFDGDTVIDGRKCKRMMCYTQCAEEYPLYDGFLSLLKPVAALYENQREVYIAYYYSDNPNEVYLEPRPLYDFGLASKNSSLVFGDRGYGNECEVKAFSSGYRSTDRFKGKYIEFQTVEDDYSIGTWLEGVGSEGGPLDNGLLPLPTHYPEELMECRVGDEVIYHNPDIIDGVNPPDEETKKRIDFTHIEKPRPRAPHRAATEESVSLNGEFSARLLDLQLGDMSDTYNVTITDDADEVVYQKTVRAADVLALNIDISEWAAPSYTINVENDYEQYIGTFELIPTDIEEVKSEELKVKTNAVYDLTGRCLTCEPKKGMYIKDGRKYLKR
ncbi:MAG: DUF3244 domain-containing protein [Bacteroidaceae bacterium]|nr:DUF3244 domain-containing protein [Bacteroidaceae bacterium]